MVTQPPRGQEPRRNPFFYIIGILVIVVAILAFLYANGMFRGLTGETADTAAPAPAETAPATPDQAPAGAADEAPATNQ